MTVTRISSVSRGVLQSLHRSGAGSSTIGRSASHPSSMVYRPLQSIITDNLPPTSLIRCHASTATSNNSNNSNKTPSSSSYVSPFQDIFDNIKQGKTSLGTTHFQMPSERKYLKCGIPENALRFKTTAFGRLLEAPFIRPNEHRIILQVHVRHIPLTETERLVLREIVGQRLNEETGVLQLSSSQFGSRIENKRHVVSMLERAVERAKVLAARVEAEVEQLEHQP
ncbi:mitochondrial ribosomal subunit protein [Nitzschia inconspicua]|uniref:Mitochondrial ribosomal subunit protein n=1 Tax=Nitzschia inconspicua TaxID=303405 RepID=A0A9K3L543_9STRA|nr:mitochondrial ribosomal subunit protein [Nitzschia inconspicua]